MTATFTPGELAIGAEYCNGEAGGDGMWETPLMGLDGQAAVACVLDFGANNPLMRAENARRIKALWNAFIGIPTEAIEQIQRINGVTPDLAMKLQNLLQPGAVPPAPAAPADEIASVKGELLQARTRIEQLELTGHMISDVLHDVVTANQAAWIEWKHGAGAEAAMDWVHNGLAGPGQLPDADAPFSKEPQAWYDANKSQPLPACFCGRPSSIAWMGQGFCSSEHYAGAKSRSGVAPSASTTSESNHG